MSLRDWVGPKFDHYKKAAEGSNFAGSWVRDLDRDELLALVGWMAEHHDASTHPGNRTSEIPGRTVYAHRRANT